MRAIWWCAIAVHTSVAGSQISGSRTPDDGSVPREVVSPPSAMTVPFGSRIRLW